MDEIDDFLDFSKNKTFQKRFITGGTVAGRIIADERETHVESRRDIPETTNYANRYERELENDLRVVSRNLMQTKKWRSECNKKKIVYNLAAIQYATSGYGRK